MKRAVMFFAAMFFAFGLPFSAAQAAETVEAGPIWNQQDAEKKCPSVCEKRGGWTGHWWTTVQGKMSVCQCKGTSSPAAIGIPAKGVYFKLQNLQSKSWIYSNSDGRFNHYRGGTYSDQYWTMIPGTGRYQGYFKLENAQSKRWIYSNSDGRFNHYRGGDFSDQYWKIVEGQGTRQGYFKLENYQSKKWIYSNSDGRFSHYRGGDYDDQYWTFIYKAQCVTDIQLTASNTKTPRPGPKGYTRLGYWDVDGGGSKGTDGSTGHWMMALYANTEKSLTGNSSCVTDVQLRASSSENPPKCPAGYKQIGYWDVDAGGSHGTDGSTGHWMMAMYANTAAISSGTQCVTDVQLTASNTGTPRPGPKGYTHIGDWDVDAGGSKGTDGSTGHWRMALYANKAAISAPKSTPQFSCEDKRSCGTMDSCEEAYYHLNTCGNKKLDHDNDSVPCETICPDDQ